MSKPEDMDSVDLKIKQQNLKNDAEKHVLEIAKGSRDATTDAVDNALTLSLMSTLTISTPMGEKPLYSEGEIVKIKAKVFRLLKNI